MPAIRRRPANPRSALPYARPGSQVPRSFPPDLIHECQQNSEAADELLRSQEQAKAFLADLIRRYARPNREPSPDPHKAHSSEHRPPRLTAAVPNHRAIDDVTVASLTRRACRFLMKRKTTKDPLPDSASEDQLVPTRLEFSLRWFEKISGVFNRAAIDVLVAEVLRRHPVELKLDDRPRVLKAACTHVVYLQKLYWASMDEDALEARLEKQRRAALKRERYDLRMEVMLDPRFPHLRVFIELFRRIGVSAMSSDEEDTESTLARGRPVYISHRKSFLSRDLSRLGWHLDELAHRYIKSRPYDRLVGDPVDVDFWVGELPSNIYEGRWYNSLNSFERDMLNARDSYPILYHKVV